ncbi:Mu homology domain-containing protein [Cyathus striatus]|nr:Mu homology domain-containing protein [Cyathus striatus]
MAIDGLILLDGTGRPIIQSGFRSTSPAYPLLHIDAFNAALSKASRPDDVDPVLYVPAYSGGLPSACCHVVCGDIRFLCPISGNVDPLFAFAFLRTFIDILHEYFGTISAITMKENFDVVYQLLEETLDAGGHPLTTSPNALRDIVLPPSLLTKLLSVAGANINTTINSGSGLGSAGGPLSSAIPWRKAGIRYASNEIFFDVVEELRAIVNKHGIPVSSIVHGKIEANARLSGTPDCVLTFENPQSITDCAFHPCVRLQRWSRDKALSFVPPDGRFILAEYRHIPSSSTITRATSIAASIVLSKDQIPVPVALKVAFAIEEREASFNITLTSKLTTKPIDNFVAEIFLGEGATGIKCISSKGRGGFGSHLNTTESGLLTNAGASWTFDSRKKILRWEISNVPPSTTWNLQGSFNTQISIPRPAHAIQLRFEIQTYTYSALKVGNLKVTADRETYKPYKGVRGKSTGNVEWRW